jgi:integrase
MILPVFGSTPIGRIQPGTVQGWVSQLIKDGKAAATVRKAHQILSMCFDGAMRDRLISVNPCAETRLPRIEKGEIRLIGMEDIDRLADAMDTRYRAMVYCGALAGLRIGEVAALRIESFDPVGRTLMVDATLSETEHGRPKRTPVKTSASRRKVSMPQQLIDEIELHLVGHQGGEFIFESPDGGPLRLRNWRRRYWSPAVKASIGGRLRFHDLRHAHVALLIRLNVQPRVIQDRLGHASIRMTMDRYGHLFEGSDQAVAQRLDEMLAGDYAHSVRPVAPPMTASTR